MAEVHIVDIDGEQWDIKDLPLTTKVNLLGDTTKIKAIGESYITPKNNIFRGKCLNGSTDIQYPILPFSNSPTLSGGGYSITQILEKIADGNFDDIYIGDYIIDSNNKVYRIAGLDTELNKGNEIFISHHAVIVTDFALTAMSWNSTNTTVGGYKSSLVQAYCNGKGKTLIESVFGAEHVLTIRELVSSGINASVTSSGYSGWQGAASSWGWVSNKVRLMSEIEVYGSKVWSGGFDIGTSDVQLPLFRLMPQLAIGMHYDYWLSGIASASIACRVSGEGNASYANTSGNNGVRVRFLIG